MTGSLALGHMQTNRSKQGLANRPEEVGTMRPPLAHVSAILFATVARSDLLLRYVVSRLGGR